MRDVEVNPHPRVSNVSAVDPWAIVENQQMGIPWSELTRKGKIIRVSIGVAKGAAILVLLYLFVCSLDLLSLGFRVLGGRTTGNIFRQSDFFDNPVVCVMVGILTTVLVQSSSTSTSIIVSMVAAGFLDVPTAIPIIMGANIGTSITNTIVSFTQIGDRNQFRRAFAGATVHDMFNWLTVIILLILEVTTHYLEKLSDAIMHSLVSESTDNTEIEILSKITKPFVNLIVQIDSNVLKCWSNPECHDHDDSSLLKDKCSGVDCKYLFHGIQLSDGATGAIIVVVALVALCTCLIFIVKLLKSVLQGQIALVVKKTLNANIPYVPWLTGYLAIIVGAVMTFLVQSSSVFTSALTPLVGLGIITVDRVYPLTLGSNIGTTTTALLGALTQTGDSFLPAMQIAVCHLFFNLTGIVLFYPVPFLRWPIGLAKFLGNTTAKYRWFAIVYMIAMFVVLPGLFVGLSFAGPVYVIVVASIICFIFLFVSLVNLLREKKPSILPSALLSWKWLPIWFRSLEPYDRILTRFACCRKLKEKGKETQDSEMALSTDNLDEVNVNYKNGGNGNVIYSTDTDDEVNTHKHKNGVNINPVSSFN